MDIHELKANDQSFPLSLFLNHDKHPLFLFEVTEILVDKGFDKFTINMYLHAGLDKETKK